MEDFLTKMEFTPVSVGMGKGEKREKKLLRSEYSSLTDDDLLLLSDDLLFDTLLTLDQIDLNQTEAPVNPMMVGMEENEILVPLALNTKKGNRRLEKRAESASTTGTVSSKKFNSKKNTSSSILDSEPREKKLARYRSKRKRRNFNKKIMYESRRRDVNSRVRVAGRFISNKKIKENHEFQQEKKHLLKKKKQNKLTFSQYLDGLVDRPTNHLNETMVKVQTSGGLLFL